ncbi:MAG: hypothetical protein AAFZ63_02545 [Bacteroidota bacterium]
MVKEALSFFALFWVVQLGMAQENPTAVESQPDTIAVVLTEHNNVALKAIVNETDTLTLMLHTAVNDVSLTKAATAGLRSIKFSSADSVESWGGTSESRYSEGNSLKIGEFNWEDVGIWESEHSGHDTDGKFGLNLFAGKIVELNFEEEYLVIHASLPELSDSYKRVPVINKNGLIFIEGECGFDIDVDTNEFLIHSGYSGSLLLDDDFVARNSVGEKVETISESTLKDSYGNELKTINAMLPTFRLGEIEFSNVPVGFFAGSINRQKMSVLGGEILKRFNIIFDLEQSDIYLRANRLQGMPYPTK